MSGDHIRLIITALDGFTLEAFYIDHNLAKGEPTPVEFTAEPNRPCYYLPPKVAGLSAAAAAFNRFRSLRAH
jgi:hypothetical protein